MKYVVVLYDGMADYPVPALGGKTPMAVAKKPNLDFLAKHGEVGLVRTVAEGLKPGSDVANMSVLGFDPKKCYTGRSPLEAASMGVELLEEECKPGELKALQANWNSYDRNTPADSRDHPRKPGCKAAKYKP